MDPVLQFQPWLEFNRRMLRQRPAAALERPGRLRGPAPGQRPERGLRPVPRDRLPRQAPRRPRLDGRGTALGRRAGDVPAGAALGPGRLGALVRGPGVPVLRLPGRLAPLPGHERGGLDALAALGERPGAGASRAADGRRAGARWRGWSCWAGTSRPAPTSCSRRPRTWSGGSVRAGSPAERRASGRGQAWAGRRGRWDAPGRGVAASRWSRWRVYLARSPVWGDRAASVEPPGCWNVLGCWTPSARRCLMPSGASGGGIPTWRAARGPQPERVGGGVRRAGHAGLARASGVAGAAAAAAGRGSSPG